MKKTKYDLTMSLGFQNTNENYFTPAGNGKAILQHKLDDKKDSKTYGKMIVKKLENGEPKTTNLFLQIQSHKANCDYKKLLELNGFDLDKVKLALDSNAKFEYYKDFTNFGGIEELKSMENKIVNTFGSIDNFKKFTEKKIIDYTAQLAKQKNYWEKAKKELEIKKMLAKTKKAEEASK